jgi:DNA-binding phage protein
MRIKKVVDYQNYLVESLRDPEEAIGYLNAALEGGDIPAFLLALQNVVKARGGISEIADKTNKSKPTTHRYYFRDI